MHSIKDLRDLIEGELSRLQINKTPKDLYQPVNYMLSLPAKRMRPVLLLCGCELFNGDLQKALSPALGIEVFHNFTLLHDDIMDNAPLRRSQKTVHEKWNTNVAILSGDAMFIKACQLIMECNDQIVRDVMQLFHKTAIEVCEGQQLDMDFENDNSVTIDDYLQMIRLKTAVLLGASLKIGAVVAGASGDDAQKLYNFGVNIGIAFQLKDDILDVFADEVKFGKQKGGDIISDKKTFLWLKANELASEDQKLELERWGKNYGGDPADKVKAVTLIYDQLNIRDIAESEMEKYYNKAMINLSEIGVPEENKLVLQGFAEQLMVREV